MSDPQSRDDHPWRDKETLRKLYLERDLSLSDVATELDCSKHTIINWMDRFGIERESRGGTPQYPPLTNKSRLQELYVDEKLSAVEIADRVGCSTNIVYSWLDRYGIERREPGRHLVGARGDEHPTWKGGHEENRGHTWRRQRERTLLRDEYQCQTCGLTNEEHLEEYDQEIHVHHIERYSSFESCVEANKLSNLITLCRPCHDELEDEPRARVKAKTLEDAREDMESLRGYIHDLAEDARQIQPGEDDE